MAEKSILQMAISLKVAKKKEKMQKKTASFGSF